MKIAEGFSGNVKKLPANVAYAWDSTFLVLFDEPTQYVMGTASLVQADVSPTGNATLYFLTSEHVVKDHCSSAGVCLTLHLAQEAKLTYEATGGLSIDSIGWNFSDVELISQSVSPDLALLKAQVHVGNGKIPGILKVSQNCDIKLGQALYTVGFSDTSVRNYPGSQPIEEKNSIFKRWSHGIFTGNVDIDVYDDHVINHLMGTSVDVLGGGSGGPVLNDKAEIVGVMKGGASAGKNNFTYYGKETLGDYDWQSYAVKCSDLASFINDGILKSR